jgi:hypothetical protein
LAAAVARLEQIVVGPGDHHQSESNLAYFHIHQAIENG